MTVYTFTNLAPGGGITCVSVPSLEAAWDILKRNGYQDMDPKMRYRLEAECATPS